MPSWSAAHAAASAAAIRLAAVASASATSFSEREVASRSAVSASDIRCSAARVSSADLRCAWSASEAVDVRSCSAWSVASWACWEAAFSIRSASARARRSSASASVRAFSVSSPSRSASLLGEPLRLGAGRREGLLGLGAGLVEEALGLRLGAGPELFGPGDVLVDVGLDGGAALGQLLVELLAPVDRLGVQLRLEAGLLLGVLLEDALGLGPHLAQLALGVAAHLVGLELGVPQHLLGLVAEVRGVVGVGTRRQRPSGLVQLGTQNLDLVAEVLGVLNGLLPVGLQPVHLGFEPREVVVSSVALLAFVAPHCAVPSVPWSRKLRTTPSADGRGSRGKWCQTARGPGLPPGAAALKPGPRPGGRPRGSDGRPQPYRPIRCPISAPPTPRARR